MSFLFFFFTDTATTDIYTLSLHDALPIYMNLAKHAWDEAAVPRALELLEQHRPKPGESDLRGFEWYYRSEEHTSELQSLTNLVCRLLLEKKKKIKHNQT